MPATTSRNASSSSRSLSDNPLSARLRWVLRIGLIAVVCAAPWPFASVWAISKLGLLLAIAGLLLVDCAYETVRPRAAVGLPTAWIPVVLGIGLGAAQLAPLPDAIYEDLAPEAHELRQELLDDADLTASQLTAENPQTRALYPAATREQLSLLVLAMSVFYLATRHFAHRETVTWLLGSITILGTALGVLGILQRLTWNGKVYWFWELTYGASPLGPFINRNSGAGYLNMCLAAAAGWLVALTWERVSEGHQRGKQETYHYPRSSRLVGWVGRVSESLSQLDSTGLGIIAAMGLMGAAIVVSLSRGGTLAMITATLAAIAVLSLRGASRKYVGPLIVSLLAAAFMLDWVGQTDDFAQRLEALGNPETKTSNWGRLTHWTDSLEILPRFLVWGAGLGNHEFVYGMAQDWYSAEGTFYYAENQFIQALIEAGVCGCVLLVGCILLVAAAIWTLRMRDRSTGTVLSVVGVFLLTSQCVAGAFDFGLYMPANAILMAVLCGMLVGRAIRTVQRHDDEGPPWYLHCPSPAGTQLAIGTLLLVGATAGAMEMQRTAVVERAWYLASVPTIRLERSAAQLDAWQPAWEAALSARPYDHRPYHHLAELSLQRHRLQSFDQLWARQAGSSGAAGSAAAAEIDLESPEALSVWDRTELFQLHETVYRLQSTGQTEALTALRQSAAEFLVPAWQHLLMARQQLPVLAHLHYSLGEIAPAAEPGWPDEAHLARAVQLAPGDASLWFWSGMLHWNAGRREAAQQAWTTTLQLTHDFDGEIVARASGRLTPAQIMEPIGEDVARLLQIAQFYRAQEQAIAAAAPAASADTSASSEESPTAPNATGAQEAALAEPASNVVLQHLVTVLAEDAHPAAAEEFVWGQALKLLDRPAEGVAKMEAAVRRQPREMTWRYELAQWLFALGRFEEASTHANLLADVAGDSRQKQFQQLREQIRTARFRQR